MDYRELARQKAAKYGIDPGFFVTQIGAESSFDPSARSPAGAVGIAQFMPATGARYGLNNEADLLNPELSLDAGAHHMSDLLEANGGDQRLALAAYNAGQGAVNKYGGIPPYKETQKYVEKIMGGRSQQSQPQEQQPMQNNYQNPMTASAVQGVMQPQEPPTPMMQDPMFWLQAAAGMGGGGGNPIAGIAQGFGQAAGAYQARNQMTPYQQAQIDNSVRMTPYQQAQIEMQKLRQAAGPKPPQLPENIREIEELKTRYPDLSDDEILSMAFTGRIPGQGTRFVMVGDTVMKEVTDGMGREKHVALTPEEKSEYDKAAAVSRGSSKTAEEEAGLRVNRRNEFVSTYQDAAQALPQQLAARKRLLSAMESGELNSKVFASGTLGRFSSDVATLQEQGMFQLLERLSQVSTGGLTEREREDFKTGLIGAHNTNPVNISVTKRQIKRLEREMRRMGMLKKELQNPEFDPLNWMPDMDWQTPKAPDAPAADTAPDIPGHIKIRVQGAS